MFGVSSCRIITPIPDTIFKFCTWHYLFQKRKAKHPENEPRSLLSPFVIEETAWVCFFFFLISFSVQKGMINGTHQFVTMLQRILETLLIFSNYTFQFVNFPQNTFLQPSINQSEPSPKFAVLLFLRVPLAGTRGPATCVLKNGHRWWPVRNGTRGATLSCVWSAFSTIGIVQFAYRTQGLQGFVRSGIARREGKVLKPQRETRPGGLVLVSLGAAEFQRLQFLAQHVGWFKMMFAQAFRTCSLRHKQQVHS